MWYLFIFGAIGIGAWMSVSSGKAGGNLRGENVCEFCRKRVKFDYGNGAYATVCPRCGRTQTNR